MKHIYSSNRYYTRFRWIVLYMLIEMVHVRRYRNRLQSFRQLTGPPKQDKPVYIPAVVHGVVRLTAMVNHLVMCTRFTSRGNGMYVSGGTPVGQTVLFIGGLGSPNVSTVYMHSVCTYIRMQYGRDVRIIIYNPPEAGIGTGTQPVHSIEIRANQCRQRLRAIDPRLRLSDVIIIGHSYGSVLTTCLRRMLPVSDGCTQTELWDPIMYRRTPLLLQRCRMGILPWIHGDPITCRSRFLGLLVRDIYCMTGVMWLTIENDTDPDKHRDTMGQLSVYIAENDEFCGHSRYTPGTYTMSGSHGDILFRPPLYRHKIAQISSSH